MRDSSVEEHLSHNQKAAGSNPAPAPTPNRHRRHDIGINRSRYETPGSALIDLHYAKLGLDRRWTWVRFQRLAGIMRVTIGELASIVRMRHSHLDTAAARNRFPAPVALLLTLLEAHVAKGPDTIANPLPNLNTRHDG